MIPSCRCFAFAAVASVAVLLSVAKPCQAQWGRYRAVTSFSYPSTPSYVPAVPLQSVYQPVIVAPAAATPIVISRPQSAYYAPAPLISYHAHPPVTAYYAQPVTVEPAVVARPAFFPRARNVYSFTPARAVPAAVIVP